MRDPRVHAERNRRQNEATRNRVLDHYGRSCRCCGVTENLSIDHVNGDGARHRQEIGIGRSAAQMDRWLIANDFPLGFQVLCGPCNQSKGNRERCVLDHSSGGAVPMTNAESARRWRERNPRPVVEWGCCSVCHHRRRLRKDGTVESHPAGGARRGQQHCEGGGLRPSAISLTGAEHPPSVAAELAKPEKGDGWLARTFRDARRDLAALPPSARPVWCPPIASGGESDHA